MPHTLFLMEPITLRQLEYALAVEKAGAICAAAKALHMSQPSLSQQLLQLEKTLGTDLFERTPSGTEPTAAGQVFLAHARNALDDVRKARMSVADLKRPLRLGVEALVELQPIITAANDAFGRRAGTLLQVVRHPTSESLVRALKMQQIDLAIGSHPASWDGVHVALGEVLLELRTPPGTTSADLGQLTWFRVPGTGPYVSSILQRLDITIDPSIVEVDSFEFARAMVDQGLGVTLVPGSWGPVSAPADHITVSTTVRVAVSALADTLDHTSNDFIAHLLRQGPLNPALRTTAAS